MILPCVFKTAQGLQDNGTYKRFDGPQACVCVHCGAEILLSAFPVRGSRCGNQDRDPPAQPHRLRQCLYVGGHFGVVECESCRGTVNIKTRECSLHGECVPRIKQRAKLARDVTRCEGCPDFKEIPDGSESMARRR